ncbi:MAG: hypothetical protein JW795_07045, partial [Chitinivibrionales bacterium]|nr:hypothetical protein [Chitinivibrionales bacterium]
FYIPKKCKYMQYRYYVDVKTANSNELVVYLDEPQTSEPTNVLFGAGVSLDEVTDDWIPKTVEIPSEMRNSIKKLSFVLKSWNNQPIDAAVLIDDIQFSEQPLNEYFNNGLTIWIPYGDIQLTDDGTGENQICQASEGSDAAIKRSIELPDTAAELCFDYHFTNTGDGDELIATINGETIWTKKGSDYSGTGLQSSGNIDIAKFAGQIVDLELRLSTVGNVNAQVQLDNITVKAYEPRDIKIDRFQVKAGRTESTASAQFSGFLDISFSEMETASEIIVGLESEYMDELPFIFPINANTYKRGKFNSTIKESGSQVSFKFDPKNGKMMFSARNVNMTGLACPMTVTVTIGDYVAQVQLDEDIINGTRQPCPPQFLMGIADSMTVDRTRVRFGRTRGADTLTVQGLFTIAEGYNKSDPLIAGMGTESFTVSGNQFINSGGAETCSKGICDEGPQVKAKFDFNRCSYTITLTGLAIDQFGKVPFGIDVFGNTLNGPLVDLGPNQSYSFWELTHYNYPDEEWNYQAKDGRASYPLDRRTDSSGYTIYESGNNGNRTWYFEDQSDGTYLTEFIYGDIGMAFDATNLLYWPSKLRLGQSHSKQSTFNGLYTVPGMLGTELILNGTILSKVTLDSKTKSITYKNQQYQAIPFTESLMLKGDIYAGTNLAGMFTGKVNRKNYTVPGIGIITINNSDTMSIKSKEHGNLRLNVKESSQLQDTTLD